MGTVRSHLETTDAALAAGRFEAAFPGIRLEVERGGTPFSFEEQRSGDDRITVTRIALTGSVRGVGSMTAAVRAARVRAGRLSFEHGRIRVDTAGPHLWPPGRSALRMADAVVEVVELDQDAFTTAARTLLRDSGRTARLPLAEATGPVAPGLVAGWTRVADLAGKLAFDEEAFDSPLLRAGLFELVTSGLLATFALTVATGGSDRTDVGPAVLRLAVDYIDSHLAEPLDVAGIADAVGVPARTLQAGFRTHVGVAPMEHVRLRRLAAARHDLLAAEAGDEETVAIVARRWGFAHLARFAERYRRLYGENPSDTLRG